MSVFDIHQQVWVLTAASGIATGCLGSQKDLQKKTTDNLQSTIDNMGIGDWKVVWGPNVWKSAPSDTTAAADHTWFVAHNPNAVFEDQKSYDTYVVSITGTATNSQVNLAEDIDVNVVVDFNRWLENSLTTFPLVAYTVDATKPYIAYGTASGAHRILNIPTSDGKTLPAYLQTIPETSRIIFTGHSLGGVLAPTVALAAVKAGMIKAPSSRVFTYPVAGPSPGNGPFADVYATAFPTISTGDSAYQVWNAVIWNAYDIVPHAWNRGSVAGQSILDIPKMYGDLPDTAPERLKTKVAGAALLVTLWLATSGVPEYIPLPGSKLEPEKPPTPQTWDEFLKTGGYQHTYAYSDIIGTPVVPSLCEPPPPDSVEGAKRLPVIGYLDKAKEEKDKKGDVATA